MTMWGLIADHTIPPTRQARYCCAALKESSGKGRIVVTGVRWAESQNRRKLHGIADIQTQSKKLHNRALTENPTATKINKSGGLSFLDDNDESRKMVEQCYQKNKVTINPIVDWTEEDVWEFIKEVAKVPYCELYDQGYERLGCIGCPLQGRKGMLEDFERYPRYKALYIKAFDKMIANHPGKIKAASGALAKPNGGGGYCSSSGADGAPDGGVSSQVVQVERERVGHGAGWNGGSASDGDIPERPRGEATAEVVADSERGAELSFLDRQFISGEAAVHTHTHTSGRGSINGTEQRSSACGYGACETIQPNHHRPSSYRTENASSSTPHTKTNPKTAQREIRERTACPMDVDAQIVPPPHGITTIRNTFSPTDKQSCNFGSEIDGNGLPSILAMAMPEHTERLEPTSVTQLQSASSGIPRREYDRNPRVADYESAEEVMEIFLNAYN